MVFSYEYSTGPNALPGAPSGEWASPLARRREFYARRMPGGRRRSVPHTALFIAPHVGNNPIRYSDPSGHMATVGEGGDYTELDKAHDEYVRQRDEAIKCQSGDRNSCSYAENHSAETAAFVVTGLVGAAALPEAGAIANAVGWKAASACATSSVCWAVTGAGGAGAAGFNSFRELKKALGDPGEGKIWHHIVEQSQIAKSGFSLQQINSVDNVLSVDQTIHAQISGYYSSNSTLYRWSHRSELVGGSKF